MRPIAAKGATMANKNLFSSKTKHLPRATAVNEAGGLAYALAPKHALAQIAATGCFGTAFYATAESQLTQVKMLINQMNCLIL